MYISCLSEQQQRKNKIERIKNQDKLKLKQKGVVTSLDDDLFFQIPDKMVNLDFSRIDEVSDQEMIDEEYEEYDE